MLQEYYLTRLKTDSTSTVLVKTYQSNLIPIVIGDRVSFAHQINNFNPLSNPFLYQCYLKCIASDLGFISPNLVSIDQGVGIEFSPTNITVFFDSRGIDIISKDNANRSKPINPNDWRLFFNLVIF